MFVRHRNADDFDEAVALIYEAALDSKLWPAALKRITDLGRGVQTTLFVFEPDSRQLVHCLASEHATSEPAARDSYLAHYARLDLRNAYGTGQPAGMKFTDFDFISEAEMARSEFYNDYLWPNDLGYVGVRSLKNDRRSIVGIAIQRSKRQGPFEPQELEILDRLTPHLLRALQMQTRLADLEAQQRADQMLYDRLPFAVILVDERGRIVGQNQPARDLLAVADGLSARQDRLQAHPADQTALEGCLRAATIGVEGGGTPVGGTVVLRRPSGRRSLAVLVMPIPRQDDPPTLDLTTRRPAAAVLVTDPELTPAPPETTLRQVHGLTRAEAALAKALAAGKSVQDYAEEARVTQETARWHLKRVFAKTDTRRQAELVRLLLTSAVLIQPWL